MAMLAGLAKSIRPSTAPSAPPLKSQRSPSAAPDGRKRAAGSAPLTMPDVSADRPTRLVSGTSSASRNSGGSAISDDELKQHHKRLRKLRALDESTKIPFILVELRGLDHKDGYIEICGKDEYGVYLALDEWLRSFFKCTKLDSGDLSDDTPLPFCDALYKWDGFMVQASDGTNNMGLASMQLVEFMCGQLSWTLGVINGGNVGKLGEIREQQIIFKAPHPMNIAAHHVMIELRSAGFIEVCGSDRAAKDALHKYFVNDLRAKPVKGHQAFSDRYYECREGVFKERGDQGDNNLGLLTVQVCDAVVRILPGWSLATMNGGNYGEHGTHREQQLVFRSDKHPLGNASHLLVEMREAGYVEVCGLDISGVHQELGLWLETSWGCKQIRGDVFCDLKYAWKYTDMMTASSQITSFFHELGWQMQVCSQGTVSVRGNAQSREQQILFRPGASFRGVVEPHLFIELYTGEGDENLYRQAHVTQVPSNQLCRVKAIGDCRGALHQLGRFLCDYLGGGMQEQENADESDLCYTLDVFLSRGVSDNNLGCWTMRFCDFMVDRLGWSFVVCNVCNLGIAGQFREQQLVFRWDGERRNIPPVKDGDSRLDEVEFVDLEFPNYWESPAVLSLKQPVNIVSCKPFELDAIQEVFDKTFKRVLTRDRVFEFQLKVSEEMPYRLEVVHAFRSENAELYRKFMERRSSWSGGTPLRAKTLDAGTAINQRLLEGEALLVHGTNPSSAMAVLKSGFSLNAAGTSTGTMFGYGIYLAEAVSKADEYARDDNGGTYPGLMALLMCRSFVGKPLVRQDAGDYISKAKSEGCDCVLGDRESKVGTYREFIFFDERQVLPEYAVIYKRQYDSDKVPENMRLRASGTTGKNWMVKLEKGWTNMAPDVSHELTNALRNDETTVIRKIGDVSYSFDLKLLRQTNMETKTSRPIRQPPRS